MFPQKKKISTKLSTVHPVLLRRCEEGPIVPEPVFFTGETLDNFKKSRIYKTWALLSPAFRSTFELGHVDRVDLFPTSITLSAETPLELFEACKSECDLA